MLLHRKTIEMVCRKDKKRSFISVFLSGWRIFRGRFCDRFFTFLHMNLCSALTAYCFLRISRRPTGICGKIKTVTQMIGTILLLLNMTAIGLPIMYIALIATIYSGGEYIYNSRHLISEK